MCFDALQSYHHPTYVNFHLRQIFHLLRRVLMVELRYTPMNTTMKIMLPALVVTMILPVPHETAGQILTLIALCYSCLKVPQC